MSVAVWQRSSWKSWRLARTSGTRHYIFSLQAVNEITSTAVYEYRRGFWFKSINPNVDSIFCRWWKPRYTVLFFLGRIVSIWFDEECFNRWYWCRCMEFVIFYWIQANYSTSLLISKRVYRSWWRIWSRSNFGPLWIVQLEIFLGTGWDQANFIKNLEIEMGLRISISLRHEIPQFHI